MPPTLVSAVDSQKTWLRSPLMTFHQNFVPHRRPTTNNIGNVISCSSAVVSTSPLLSIPTQQQPMLSPFDGWKRHTPSPITTTTSIYSKLATDKEGVPLICRKSYLRHHQPEKRQTRASQDHRNCWSSKNYRNDNSSSCTRNRAHDIGGGGASSSSLSSASLATTSSSLSAAAATTTSSKTNLVISEECYMNSENCLPRIIKPRKRRKKDRKPSVAMLVSPSSAISTLSANSLPQLTNAGQKLPTETASMSNGSHNETRNGPLSSSTPTNTILMDMRMALLRPNTKFKSTSSNTAAGEVPDGNSSLISRSLIDILADSDEQNRTSSSEELGDELSAEDGVLLEGTTSVCRCKYCEPESVVWDVSQRCFSPNLMPPIGQAISDQASSSPKQNYSSLRRSSSEPTSKPFTNPVVARVRSFSSGSCDKFSQNLLVSSQIVTSHDGHRDIEVKFFSLSTSSSNVPE